jgi:adenylate cyclase
LVKGKKFESDFKSPIHKGKEKQQVELLLQFLESSKNYCVCIVDMIGSTNVAMRMSNEKIGMYYGAFLNLMAEIASSFGATVIKNIGDSLLYYFPKTDSNTNEPFKDVLKCSMAMIQKRHEINTRMHLYGLPDVNYRISCEYGSVIIAKMSTSSVNDIFGNSVNLCSKINFLASPNSIVIGKGLYQKTKLFSEYVFTRIKDTQLSLGKDYRVYSVSNKNNNRQAKLYKQ